MERKKQIGVVGVDSGQILICDPCYIDGEWDADDKYERDQVFDIEWKGEHVVVDMGKELSRGHDFMTPLSEFLDWHTMNDLVAMGVAKERPVRETFHFGYNGCCRASGTKNGGGQLNYSMGHAGAGVAVRSGGGDGVYPVIAHYNEDGLVTKVEIIFDDEE